MNLHPYEDADPDAAIGCARTRCPACRTVRKVDVFESLNWGNITGTCQECGSEFDITRINHRAILAEAKRGFVEA